MYNLIISILTSDVKKNDKTHTPLNHGTQAFIRQKGVLGKNTSPPYR